MTNRTQKVVAFLDLLGFSNNTRIDADAALLMIDDYHYVINNKIFDCKTHPELNEQNEGMCADSFECFLPFSDSVFIVSTNPDKFVKQVSDLMSRSFSINLNHYTDSNTIVNSAEKIINTYNESGEDSDKTTHKKNYIFPVLFRGGVSFGNVSSIDITSKMNNEKTKTTNLIGIGVIDAVGLEKSGKGPRLFCNKNFHNQLSDAVKDKYIGVVKEGELFEIYWIVSNFNERNSIRTNLQEFDKYFDVAVKFWMANNHLDYGNQYFEFIKLIINGTIHYFKKTNDIDNTIIHIVKQIKNSGLELKMDTLINSTLLRDHNKTIIKINFE